MKHKTAIALSAIAIIALIAFYPSIGDFLPGNPYWNGLSALKERFKPITLSQTEEIEGYDALNHTLMIIGPDEPFTPKEVEAIENFLSLGGLLIVADDFGSANTLLSGLNLPIRVNGGLMLDPLYKWKALNLPRITDFRDEYEGLSVDMNNPSILEIGDGARPLARSSYYSFIDENLNGVYDEGEPVGPFPVMAEFRFGEGRVIALSDPSIFINAMFDRGGYDLLLNAMKGRRIILDLSHYRLTPLDYVKGLLSALHEFLGRTEIKYTMLLLAAFLLIRWHPKPKEEVEDELEKVIRLHPEWNEVELRVLYRELKRSKV